MSLSQTMAALGQSIAAATAAVDKYQSDVDVAIADRDNRILILAQQNDLLRTENADLQAQLAKPTTPPTPPVTPPAGELAVLNRVPSRAEVAMIDRAALRTILGDYRLKAGETLENALVKGCVTASYIKGQTPGRIRNCVIDALDEKAYCVNFTGNQMDVLVENCELVNSRAGATYGEHYKLRRCHIHGHQADAGKLQRFATMEECVVEDLGKDTPDAHADGSQTDGTKPRTDPRSLHKVQIVRCLIVLKAGTRNGHTYKATQGVIFGPRAGMACFDLLVEGCVIIVTNGKTGQGIRAYTGTGNGSSIRILNNDITAEIPLALETGVIATGNKLTTLPRTAA
jgi:hypothetical protein